MVLEVSGAGVTFPRYRPLNEEEVSTDEFRRI